MYGVVLAAGKGTRLRPRTAEKPKGLVDVAGKPILTRCFETLLALGVDELVVVVGYQGNKIVSHYGDRFDGVPLTYAYQDEQRGLAHALGTVESHVSGDGDFVSMNGDNVCEANLSALVARHRAVGADATLLTEEVSVDEASKTGVLSFDERGRVTGLVEKPTDPPSTTVPRGVYAFSPRVFEACRAIDPSPTGEYELTAAIDWLLAHGGTVETVDLEGWCVNVNTEAERRTAERLLSGE